MNWVKIHFLVLLVLLLPWGLSGSSCEERQPRLDFSEGLPEVEEGVTPPSSEVPTAAFIAFGDWGDGSERQLAVAEAMLTYCSVNRCQFAVTVGDNFYNEGVKSVDDPQWQEKFRDIYGPLNIPFYPSLGNHDVYGNEQAQVDYSKIDPNWRMPAFQYTFTWPEGSEEPLLEFFIVGVNKFTEADRAWLTDAIDRSVARWKFLVRHYPFLTNRPVIESSDALLEKAICGKLDFVLSGHNHLFSVLRGLKDECWIEQIIVGTGGAQLQEQSPSRDDGRLITTASVHGFGWFEVSEEVLTFRMIGTENPIFSSHWTKKKNEVDTGPDETSESTE